MKRKINLLILSILILLILFMANVIGKLDNPHGAQDPDSGTARATAGNGITGENTPNTGTTDSAADSGNTEEEKDSLSGEDILPSDGASPGSEKDYETGSDLSRQTNTVPITRKTLRQLSAGTVIDVKVLGDTLMDTCFYYEKIKDDIKSRITGKSYKADCTVPFGDLRYVRVLYCGFDEKTHIGELIVNKAIAADIVDIFAELYDKQYPIERMVLVDEYDADDNASMAANNTSSFNYRSVPGSTHLSKHALGLAIDINPLYNPYIQYTNKGTTILPVEGSTYADRTLDCAYYIDEDDLCYQAFTKRGFTWGGFWKSEPDYQHFQKAID